MKKIQILSFAVLLSLLFLQCSTTTRYNSGDYNYYGKSPQAANEKIVTNTQPDHESELLEDIITGAILNNRNSNEKLSVEKDIFGNTIIKDNQGNKTTIEKDIFDNLIIKDNKGNKTTIEKDIFDNRIIKHR